MDNGVSLFQVLGAAVALYTANAAITGEVHAKDGIRMRVIIRQDEPIGFWSVIVCYGLLAVMLLVYF